MSCAPIHNQFFVRLDVRGNQALSKNGYCRRGGYGVGGFVYFTPMLPNHYHLSAQDAGRKFDVDINGTVIASIEVDGTVQGFYDRDIDIPASLSSDKLVVRFAGRSGSIAGGLYGLRLLRSDIPFSISKPPKN